MATGTVKWFNNAKGFGFICSDEEEGDIFAHYSTIQMDGYRTLKAGQMDGYRTLKAGQQVSYEIEKGPKGCHASSVVPIEAQAK
ncbi:cold shock domain protein CspD [Vibrio parahaemolyticus]|uniref:cold shock domain-containing protein n=1 Tax=Vibrio parahaemolyticus TaxID=670 RepID=UPI00084A5083|nr:cold shock domain-containing protein [Vibrio parahaemolyticus]OEA86132.1 cold shock domain protein CspD [Vibrio parahaemolyticus]